MWKIYKGAAREEGAVTVRSVHPGSQGMAKQSPPQKARPLTFYQGNMIKILRPHENQSVLYQNLKVIAERDVKLTVQKQGYQKWSHLNKTFRVCPS